MEGGGLIQPPRPGAVGGPRVKNNWQVGRVLGGLAAEALASLLSSWGCGYYEVQSEILSITNWLVLAENQLDGSPHQETILPGSACALEKPNIE